MMAHPVGACRCIQSVISVRSYRNFQLYDAHLLSLFCTNWFLLLSTGRVKGSDLKERGSANTYIMPTERLRLRGISGVARIKSL